MPSFTLIDTMPTPYYPSNALQSHRTALLACRQCPAMLGPVVCGQPVYSKVLLVGQAPGAKEGEFGKPFAWTAGKTLFGWFAGIGLSELRFRELVYMAAVCRCFPGKQAKGGDRLPNPVEVANCSAWLQAEIQLLQPQLVIPVGKLAIGQWLKADKLQDVIGRQFSAELFGHSVDLIPLPHPSGASTWHRSEPGKSLLVQALGLIAEHPAWRALL